MHVRTTSARRAQAVFADGALYRMHGCARLCADWLRSKCYNVTSVQLVVVTELSPDGLVSSQEQVGRPPGTVCLGGAVHCCVRTHSPGRCLRLAQRPVPDPSDLVGDSQSRSITQFRAIYHCRQRFLRDLRHCLASEQLGRGSSAKTPPARSASRRAHNPCACFRGHTAAAAVSIARSSLRLNNGRCRAWRRAQS
jgi:hypothetical protein